MVVYMHAGAEGSAADHVTGREEYYLGEDRGNPEAFAHMAIDAGASLVIASGPHVLRGMQFYQGHLIAYSLGNFASYGNFATSGDLGMSVILHVTLSASRPVPDGPDRPGPVHQLGPAGAGRRGDCLHRPAEQAGLRFQRGTHLAPGRHHAALRARYSCGMIWTKPNAV